MERGAQIVQIPQKIIDEMLSRRRDFHKYPERGWAEFRTTAVCADALLKLGWRVRFADEFIEPERVMGREVDAAAEKRRAAHRAAESFSAPGHSPEKGNFCIAPALLGRLAGFRIVPGGYQHVLQLHGQPH